MDKTRTDDEARNIKDATVADPEVNVCCVSLSFYRRPNDITAHYLFTYEFINYIYHLCSFYKFFMNRLGKNDLKIARGGLTF